LTEYSGKISGKDICSHYRYPQ